MSSHRKTKLKADPKTKPHGKVEGEEAFDDYWPEPQAVLGDEFETRFHGKIAVQHIIWEDSKFCEVSVNVYKLIPKGMAMTTYVPVIVGSYPMPNRKH